jgi:hypothetical protein
MSSSLHTLICSGSFFCCRQASKGGLLERVPTNHLKQASLDQNLFALILQQKLLFNTKGYTPALLDDDSLIDV